MDGVLFRAPSLKGPPNAIESYRRVNRYRYGQMALLGLVFAFSASTLLELTSVIIPIKEYRAGCCVFVTRFSLQAVTNGSYQLKVKDGVCGYSSDCSLMQFVWSLSSAVAFVMIWFFGFFHPKVSAFAKRKESTSARVVLPSIVIFIICSILILVATVIISIGNTTFCGLNRIEFWRKFDSSCFGVPKMNITDDDNPVQVNFGLLRDGEITAWISTLLWILNTTLLFYRFYNHIDYPDYFFENKSRRHPRSSEAKPNDETSFTSTNSKGAENDQNNEEEDNPTFERRSSESIRLSRRKKKRRVNFDDFYADSPPNKTKESEPAALIQFENENGDDEEEKDEFETADSETPNEDDAKNDEQRMKL